MKKRVYLFYYDDFAEFEIVLTALQFKDHEIVSVALENREYRSEERQRFLPDMTVEQVDPEQVDIFVIPGGDPEALFEDRRIGGLLQRLNERGATIVAICGGPSLLAAHGLLRGRRCTGNGSGIMPEQPGYELFADAQIVQEGVVQDGNIVTATGGAFTDLCLYLGKIEGLYESDEEYERDRRWIKNLPQEAAVE